MVFRYCISVSILFCRCNVQYMCQDIVHFSLNSFKNLVQYTCSVTLNEQFEGQSTFCVKLILNSLLCFFRYNVHICACFCTFILCDLAMQRILTILSTKLKFSFGSFQNIHLPMISQYYELKCNKMSVFSLSWCTEYYFIRYVYSKPTLIHVQKILMQAPFTCRSM